MHGDVVGIIVDLERGFGRVDHPPDDDGGDLNGIAVVIAAFQMVRFEVTGSAGDLLLRVEGGWPNAGRIL